MSLLFSVHLASTWALIGMIWTIQCVHYPLFAQVGAANFRSYHKSHTTLITWVVAPLMLTELGSAIWLVLSGPSDPWFQASLFPLAFNWVSTWIVQIPLHNKLATAFDASTHRKLVLTNWWRTVAWTSRGLCLFIVSH